MRTRKDLQHQTAVDAMRGLGPNGHSPLFLWMWQNHDAILAEHKVGRPDWAGATAAFSAMGYTAKNGKPLKPENVRKVWSRVVDGKAALASRPHQQSAAQPRDESSNPGQSDLDGFAADEFDDIDRALGKSK